MVRKRGGRKVRRGEGGDGEGKRGEGKRGEGKGGEGKRGKGKGGEEKLLVKKCGRKARAKLPP